MNAQPGSGTATFKARDVEELIDFYLHRRAANWVVRVLAKTTIRPDQVTLASGTVALVAGVVIGTASGALQLWLGAFLFFAAIVLDCSDGQLARLKGQSTFAGRYLDGMVDAVATGAIFVGHFVFMVRHGVDFWWTFWIGWLVGYCVKWHAHTYDHLKNIYLLNTEEPKRGEDAYPSLDAIDAEEAEHLRQGRVFTARLCRGFRRFTIAQRKADEANAEARVAHTPEQRALYREVYRRNMRLWTFNGLGTHLFLLVVATVASAWNFRAVLVAWALILVPLSLLSFALLAQRKTLAARYQARHPRS